MSKTISSAVAMQAFSAIIRKEQITTCGTILPNRVSLKENLGNFKKDQYYKVWCLRGQKVDGESVMLLWDFDTQKRVANVPIQRLKSHESLPAEIKVGTEKYKYSIEKGTPVYKLANR